MISLPVMISCPASTRLLFAPWNILGCAALFALALCLAACTKSEPEPPRLILLSVDTLRADHLGAYGSTLGLTPQIDALAEESLVFDNAYSPSPFTLGSVGSLLTGRYPAELGIEWNRSKLVPGIPTLAAILAEKGWETAAVVSNFVLRGDASGIEAGFEHYDDAFPQYEATRRVPERIGASTTEAAIATLDRLGSGEGGFFLWVHYQDPHGPYTPGEEIRESRFDADRARRDGSRELRVSLSGRQLGAIPKYQLLEERRDPEFYRAGYEGEVGLVDDAIGGLLLALRERGLFESATIVFVADHGESLGEGDLWFAHGQFLNDALVRIPFMIKRPGVPAGRRTDVTSLVDVVPTLLASFGIEEVPGVSGRNLLADGAAGEEPLVFLTTLREATRPRFGIVGRGFKYILTPRLPGESGAPGPHHQILHPLGEEARSIEQTRPELANEMRRQLLSLHDSFEIPEQPSPHQALSPEEERQLEALGYVEGRVERNGDSGED